MRKKSERSNKKREKQRTLLDILQEERKSAYFGGMYHKTQIELTYHSNRMDGSRLTHDQARYIFETNTNGVEKEALNVDDVIETDDMLVTLLTKLLVTCTSNKVSMTEL